jgi:hypothetical protein
MRWLHLRERVDPVSQVVGVTHLLSQVVLTSLRIGHNHRLESVPLRLVLRSRAVSRIITQTLPQTPEITNGIERIGKILAP